MSARDEQARRWLKAYLRPLVGARIVGVRLEHSEGQCWPVLQVVLPDVGTQVELEISSDEEGNGPGFLHGLPFPGEAEVAP